MPHTIENPSGAFGYTDFTNRLNSYEVPFRASAAVSAKRLVSIDTNGDVATTATSGAPRLVVGVAAAAIGEGKVGNVIVGGIAEDVPCTGTVNAGDLVTRSTSTAGSVQAVASPNVGDVVGVAINNASGGTVDVWVFKA